MQILCMLLSKNIYYYLNMNGFNMSTVTNYMLGSTQVRNIYYGSNLIWPLTHDYSQDYLTFEAIDTGKFTWSSGDIYYSTDNGSTWNTLYGSTANPGETTTINAGDKILFKATYLMSGNFGSTGRFNVMGNVMSLLYGDNFVNQTTLTRSIFNLFNGCSQLLDASNLILPATTLITDCYTCMFQNCSSLTAAPELPATTLAQNCYSAMFSGCSSLTAAPELPATTLANRCYYDMFYGCSSLNYIKCLATNISATDCTANWLYNVAATGTFTRDQNNTSWTIGTSGIPSGWTVVPPLAHDYSQDYLTFEALESGTFTWTDTQNSNSISYSTDNGSTWSTLASGSSTPTIATNNKVMFKASGLTISSIGGIGIFSSSGNFNAMGNVMSLIYGDNFVNQTDLTGLNYVFNRLFYQNTKLISAENLILPATILSENCYYQMFRGCTSLITAPELPATTLASYCYYYMFRDCTSLTTAPELPATIMQDWCYCWMFQNCTSLTTAPELPATTLVNYCYNNMFNGCSSLNYIKCLATNISASNCVKNWLTGVASSGTFVKAVSMSSWPRSASGIPSGWTVQNAS